MPTSTEQVGRHLGPKGGAGVGAVWRGGRLWDGGGGGGGWACAAMGTAVGTLRQKGVGGVMGDAPPPHPPRARHSCRRGAVGRRGRDAQPPTAAAQLDILAEVTAGGGGSLPRPLSQPASVVTHSPPCHASVVSVWWQSHLLWAFAFNLNSIKHLGL